MLGTRAILASLGGVACTASALPGGVAIWDGYGFQAAEQKTTLSTSMQSWSERVTSARFPLTSRGWSKGSMRMPTLADPHDEAGGCQAARHLLHLGDAVDDIVQLVV